jgi:hypothetical protein
LAKRDEKVRQESFREQLRPEVSAAKPQASGSGQVVLRYGRLPPVQRGCHIEFRTFAQGGPWEGGGGNVQICK